MYTVRITTFNGKLTTENYLVKTKSEAAVIMLNADLMVSCDIVAQIEEEKLREVFDGKEAGDENCGRTARRPG